MRVSAKEAAMQPALGMKAVVALVHVADVQRSIEFYQKLGFELGNQPLKNEMGVSSFARLHRGQAVQIMVTLTGRPLNPGAQDVMFYLYVDNFNAYREAVIAQGVAVGEVKYPFWSPKGEFRIDDPDGWTWMVC